MPIDNVRLSAPTYNSDRDIPPFNEYHDMFLNFVDYQNGGRSFITLAMYNLGRAFNTTASFTREGMENGLILENEDLAALEEELLNANEAENQERRITEYSDLTTAEKQLDKDLYSILSQCITGKHRVIISNVQFRSFVQAWVRLVSTLGANNLKRKTDLFGSLTSLKFNGDTSRFKTQATQIINDLYNNKVTLEDMMMHFIMAALPQELMALKIVQADKLNEDDKTSQDVYSFIETTSVTLELAGLNRRSHSTATLNMIGLDETCGRCGRQHRADLAVFCNQTHRWL